MQANDVFVDHANGLRWTSFISLSMFKYALGMGVVHLAQKRIYIYD